MSSMPANFNSQLRRFTLDRMIAILGKLDNDIEMNVMFKTRRTVSHSTPQAA